MFWPTTTTRQAPDALSDAARLLESEEGHLPFSGELAEAYQAEEAARSAVVARKAAWLILPIWSLMILLDLFTLRPIEIMNGSAFQLVGLATVPLLLWSARRPTGMAMRAVPGVLVVLGLSILGKLLAVTAVGGVVRYDGLLLFTVACYVFSGLPRRRAAGVGLTLWLAYLLALPFFELQREVMTTIYLLIGNAVGAGASGLQEHARRLSFLQRRVLSEERDQLEELGERLGELAARDTLTGLANRRTLLREGRRTQRVARRQDQVVVLAMLDIDHFKNYNDSLGHLAGDVALVRVAEVLSALGRRATDVVARYGGEEFTALRIGDSPAAAAELGEEILERVRALGLPHPAGGNVTVSVGVAVLGSQESVEEAMARADVLLYQAKAAGRDRCMIEDRPPQQLPAPIPA